VYLFTNFHAYLNFEVFGSVGVLVVYSFASFHAYSRVHLEKKKWTFFSPLTRGPHLPFLFLFWFIYLFEEDGLGPEYHKQVLVCSSFFVSLVDNKLCESLIPCSRCMLQAIHSFLQFVEIVTPTLDYFNYLIIWTIWRV